MDWNSGMDYGIFVCGRRHRFTLCSSFFCSFPLGQTSEEPPLLQQRLLAMYRMCQLKLIKYACNLWPLPWLWLRGGCTNEGQYKAELANNVVRCFLKNSLVHSTVPVHFPAQWTETPYFEISWLYYSVKWAGIITLQCMCEAGLSNWFSSICPMSIQWKKLKSHNVWG